MSEVPEGFRARIAEHNRQCVLAAIVSLLGGWLVWTCLAAVYTGAVLLLDTVRTGDTNLLRPPFWYLPAGVVLIVVLFAWAGIDRWKRRFRPLADRSIIGWHLIPDVLLLPARVTLAVWDHLAARIVLTRRESAEAWRLLCAIGAVDRVPASSLALEFPDARLLSRLLAALQLVGWIDLLPGEEDWYYRVPASEKEALERLMSPREES